MENAIWKPNPAALSDIRRLKDLSPEQIARVIKKSRQSVMNYEKGQATMRLEDVCALANKYGIHPLAFLTRVEVDAV